MFDSKHRGKGRQPAIPLPTIPLIDLGRGGPVALIDRAPAQLKGLLNDCERHYGRPLLRLGDAVTRRWLAGRELPYAAELATIVARVGRPGTTMLNFSYEWSCTCGVGPDPGQQGSRLLRTLDWPTRGLGRNVVVARQEGATGVYYNATWPGFVGVLTAMAPGRFSAAINQPPMARRTPLMPLDWLIGRSSIWNAEGLPPAHLLRQVFEECATYAEAMAMLRDAPLCAPVFFTLSGAAADEGCVIERLPAEARVHAAPTSIANHWRGFDRPGHARGDQSEERVAAMDRLRRVAPNDLSWLAPPILNPTTRIAAVMNAAGATLVLQGWEREGAATAVFTLAAPDRAGTTDTTRDSPTVAPA
jgi:hypothetical protein